MRELDKVLNQTEKVLWEGMPQFLPFFFGSIAASFLFGVMWLGFLMWGFFMSKNSFLFFTPHFWIGIFLVVVPPLYSALVYKYTYYAITDKRVIIQMGVIGRDFKIVDFDQITNAEVDVGVTDKLFGKDSGTILISTAGSFAYARRQGVVSKPYGLRSVTHPYEVFKYLKKVSYDVKTDIEYPNQLRPGENPGYRSQYQPDEKMKK